MRIGRFLGMFVRFLRNPRPYLDVWPYRFFGNIRVIRFYRKFILPVLVWHVGHKKRVNVVFLAMSPDMWKYDRVYCKLVNDARFKPIIVTAMRNVPNVELRMQEQEAMVSYFSAKGYNVVRGYDVESKKWIKLGKLRPDIIFHTQPYSKVIERALEFFNHLGVLHCYSPYSFQLSNVDWNWDNNLQQYCWKIFYVCQRHLEQSECFSRVGRVNAIAAGYSLEEEYAEVVKDTESANAAWKNDGRKRVIWAPHHSIGENEWFKVSSFLEIADLMVKLREEYKEEVVFAFKPHPVLKTKLYNVWGQERTDAYYDDWAKSSSSFDAQGDYHALFAGSDAMIHCSGSFIVEYLYTGKPVAYVYSKTRNPPDIGLIGNAALDAHYPIYNEIDIRHFLDEVILGGHDSMRVTRQKVVDKYLKSSNGKMFSENVYNSMVEGLRL